VFIAQRPPPPPSLNQNYQNRKNAHIQILYQLSVILISQNYHNSQNIWHSNSPVGAYCIRPHYIKRLNLNARIYRKPTGGKMTYDPIVWATPRGCPLHQNTRRGVSHTPTLHVRHTQNIGNHNVGVENFQPLRQHYRDNDTQTNMCDTHISWNMQPRMAAHATSNTPNFTINNGGSK
jgi:hypothetical protein